jgi:hypothetical protein
MKKQVKIARGYRLLPQTHKKILKIQKLLNSDSEKAISTACAYFIKNFLEKSKQKAL